MSFQGEFGSYSHQACLEVFDNPSVLACLSFETAIDSVRSGESEYAILPVENSTYGRVADIHQLLPRSGLKIVKEHFLRIRIHLLGLKGVKLDEITTAVSQTELLGQCKNFLAKNNIRPRVGPDTAGSAKNIAKDKNRAIGALASKLAGDIYGLVSIESDIEDMKHNTTRFLVMSAKSTEKFDKNLFCMTTIVFEVRNIPAALYKAMGGFATNGVNMVKLESYMVEGSFRATQFYADIEGHPDDISVKRAIEELRYFTSTLKILGVYRQHKFRSQEKFD